MVVDPSGPSANGRKHREDAPKSISHRMALALAVGTCMAMAAVAATAAHQGWRVFACVLSVGTAAAAFVAVRMLVAPHGQRRRTIDVANGGTCPDTHVQKGRACALSPARISYNGMKYALAGSADRAVCLDRACKRRMGPIPDLTALDDAQIVRVCKMFRGRPFSQLTALDSRCPR